MLGAQLIILPTKSELFLFNFQEPVMVLTELSPGQRAGIKNMNQLGRTLRRKLMVMGLLPQTGDPLSAGGPPGDPLQVQCQGICLSMQKSLAQHIEVEPV